MSKNDKVDDIVQQWLQERPELDTGPMAPIGRLYRVFHHLSVDIEAVHKTYSLTTGEFDVLATLRRHGTPYCVTPTTLFRTAMLSSGAMTNRLNRLEKKALIERLPDPDDRRSLMVKLTKDGLSLIDSAVEAHLKKEHDLIAMFSEEEQQTLNILLRKWLAAFE